jgi:hypothetical protein
MTCIQQSLTTQQNTVSMGGKTWHTKGLTEFLTKFFGILFTNLCALNSQMQPTTSSNLHNCPPYVTHVSNLKQAFYTDTNKQDDDVVMP